MCSPIKIYNLLKDDGILIVGERMIPDILEIESKGIQGAFRVISNWNEVCFGARPYTEKSFGTFISSICFNEKKIERLREGDISFRRFYSTFISYLNLYLFS